MLRRAGHFAGLAFTYGLGTAIDDPREFARLAGATLRGRMRARVASWDDRDFTAPDFRERIAQRLHRAGQAAPGLTAQVADIVTGWVSHASDHEAATTRLTALGEDVRSGDATSDWLFQAARVTASAGLFAASHPFLQRGYTRVLEGAARDAGFSARLRGVLVELHRRRVGAAIDRWIELAAERRVRGLPGAAASALETVMSAITNRPLLDRSDGPDPEKPDPWRQSIAGLSVAVVGPAASRHPLGDYDLRAGVANLARLRDPLANFDGNDIVYLNDETWTTHPRSEILAAVGGYRWLVLKSETSDPPPRSRVLPWGAGQLFLSGRPNLMPLICFDLLNGGADRLFLTGMDFYSSPSGGSSTDAPVLRESARIASHNPIENRAFIANLLESSRISADPVVESVARIEDLDYLRLLDEHYGRPRR